MYSSRHKVIWCSLQCLHLTVLNMKTSNPSKVMPFTLLS
jgi:hypothetical protein